MSSNAITEEPDPQAPAEGERWQPLRETAPSVMRPEEPGVARTVGFLGLFLLLLGALSLLLNLTFSYRNVIGPMWGSLAVLLGTGMMLYHAISDGDLQVRRAYGFLGFLWLFAGVLLVGIALLPSATPKSAFYPQAGYASLILGLLFLISFARHETDRAWHDITLYAVGGVGVVLALAGLIGNNVSTDFLINHGGLLLSLFGLAYLWAFVSMRGTGDDLAYRVGVAVGAVGLFMVLVALGHSFLPTLFFRWGWINQRPPADYLESAGILIMAVGIVYTAVAAGLVSDSRFVVLTRRELSAFFYSPMAYVMLFCFAGLAAFQYWKFVGMVIRGSMGEPLPEPIIGLYIFDFAPVLAMILVVPLITMRLFAEERRSASLEVLFTAPVKEAPVVWSKFVASLIFFVMLWLPFGLFLLALRIEGGEPFDYRPLISFTIALLASGSSFLAMGLFISSLTRNQVVAGVLTAVALVILFIMGLVARQPAGPGALITGTPKVIMESLSYINIWEASLEGRLYPKDLIVHFSVAAFWLYLTTKVLEARKWS